MNKSTLVFVLLALASSLASAQDAGKTLAATIEVYVFPTEGQAADQQSKEEAECYSWAATSTGNDPFQLQKEAVEDQQETDAQLAQAQGAAQGAGARGAVGGAAAGALIGEISGGDAGDSAAIGAAVGAVAARRRGRDASNQAQAQAQSQGAAKQESSAQQIENFKKAFSVCLEAKDYLVKY